MADYHHSICCLGACGQLLVNESGTVDLKDVTGRCTVSIGRPLDEVIHIKVESGSLNCRKSYVLTHIMDEMHLS